MAKFNVGDQVRIKSVWGNEFLWTGRITHVHSRRQFAQAIQQYSVMFDGSGNVSYCVENQLELEESDG